MPQLDGWSVLAALKGDPELAEIPVVMLTIVDDKTRGYSLGAAEYLIKPIDRGRLKAVLRRHCGPRGRVLVVDDDPDVRDWTREMISRDGFQVIEACNGREALSRLETEPADVILLDLLMPEMDGFAFLDELRKHDQLKELPVVVLTAKDLTEQDHAWLNGGVARVLQKGASGRDDILNELAVNLPAGHPGPPSPRQPNKPDEIAASVARPLATRKMEMLSKSCPVSVGVSA